jgi:glycine cleavage system transcriptional repressor
MKQQVALSAIGPDRPGIVAALARVLYDKGCNLEESSMTRLKGEFAILLLVTLPDVARRQELEASVLTAARGLGLTAVMRDLSRAEMSSEDDSRTEPYTLVVYGADRPGIVFRITETAARHQINITDLRTRVTRGAAPVYSLVMELELPPGDVERRFRDELEALKAELSVETSLLRVEADEL